MLLGPPEAESRRKKRDAHRPDDPAVRLTGSGGERTLTAGGKEESVRGKDLARLLKG